MKGLNQFELPGFEYPFTKEDEASIKALNIWPHQYLEILAFARGDYSFNDYNTLEAEWLRIRTPLEEGLTEENEFLATFFFRQLTIAYAIYRSAIS